jgi:hypothetical protein
VVTPVWWAYAAAATGWLTLAYGVTRTVAVGVALVRGAAGVVIELAGQLWRPCRRWGWRVVKTGRLFRTLGWVYSAWLVTYSSEDDEAELDLVMTVDDDYLMTADEEYNTTNDDDHDFDQLGVGVHRQIDGENPTEEGWFHDYDSWWDDWTEQLEEYVFEEIPYRVGLAVKPFVDFGVSLPVWGILEGVSLVVLTFKLEYQRVWHAFLTRRSWWAFPVVLSVWTARAVVWAAVFVWLVDQLDYAALRVELTCTWGFTWREEYYLGWVVFCFLSSVYLVGPLGWKDFLFRRVGWNYLAGLFVGATEVAAPEEYQLTRPVTPYGAWLERTAAGAAVRDDVLYPETELDVDTGPTRVGMGYDTTRLVLAREYGYDDLPYDDINDLEIVGFVFPLHMGVRNEPTLYPQRPSTSEYVRATRDGSGYRTDRYALDYPLTNMVPFYVPGPPPGLTPVERSNSLNREDHAPE